MTEEIKKVGVVGAGQMGSGIAHVAALGGFDVVVSDVSEDRLKSSLATISGNMARQVASGKIKEAEKVARDRGACWLHVDFERHLAGFYRACGFRPTEAGLIKLR